MRSFWLSIAFSLIIIGCEKDFQSEIVYGILTDARDSTVYSTVTIGGQTWMSENLAYLPVRDSMPHIDSIREYSRTSEYYYLLEYTTDTTEKATQEEYQKEFGVLYNWQAALSSCPEGWKLPSDFDWKQLESYLGMKGSEADKTGWRISGNVDIKLKSTYGWYYEDNGTNESGLNVRPASYINAPSEPDSTGHSAFFWTSTIDLDSKWIWTRGIRALETGIARYTAEPSRGLSVRCVKNKT
jgi:uncharacterized protein (TIGR02145 family)